MKIAILAEGSYPYVHGGVSTWIHQLVSVLSDKEFKIVSIMPSKDEKLEYKYAIPKNVTQIKTIYWNSFYDLSPTKRKKEPKLTRYELGEIEKFLKFDGQTDWEVVLNILTDKAKLGDPIEFLKSETFWNILLRIYYERYPKEEFNRFYWTMQSMFVPLISMIQSEAVEADVCHPVSTGYAGLLGLIYKKKHNIPLILTEHGIYAREREEEIIKANWVEGTYKKMWIDFFYLISIGVYRNVEAITSLFHRNRSIQVELGADVNRTVVIPNGVDAKAFKVEREGLTGHNIGAILRIAPIKDVKTLIRSFKIVKAKISESKLFLIGSYEEDENYYEECKRLIAILELDDSVVFTGQVEIKEHLSKLDVLVLTSVSEGQPLVMLEGMAAGIPFVATDVGACRELIEGIEGDDIGPAGIVTKTVAPNETAAAIVRLLEDKELNRKMGGNARNRIEEYYDKISLITSYREIYDFCFYKDLSYFESVKSSVSGVSSVTRAETV